MRVLFDAQHVYYLPHYLPVMHALVARGAECVVVSRDRSDPEGTVCRRLLDGAFPVTVCSDDTRAIEHARRAQPDWIVVGNDNPYWKKVNARSALLYHGNGVKRVYYGAHLRNVDVRFVEGPYRTRELASLYPDVRFETVGFPKLDPLLNGSVRGFDLAAHGLDAAKPTLLYAPTFFPSSIERMPLEWPAQLADCNIIIKPHQFSLTKPAYREQQKRFALWAKAPNVFVAGASHSNLVPFMAVADMLVSEASSALFEFAALDRPIVWCDFLKLRWSYRGPLRFRLRKRMDSDINAYADVGAHARSPKEFVRVVRAELAAPERHAQARARITEELLGIADGRASERVADVLLAPSHSM